MDDIKAFQETKPALYARFEKVAAFRQASVHLIMEGVGNHSNLGAIARTCDGLGIQQISFQARQKEAQRGRMMLKSSMAATRWLDYVPFEETKSHFDRLQKGGYTIFATTPTVQGTSLYDVDFKDYKKVAIAVGGEANGLSEVALKEADVILNIPMCGVVQSLNVSVATAIVLSEVVRQRDGAAFRFSPAAQKAFVFEAVRRHTIRKLLPQNQTAIHEVATLL